MPHPAAPRTKLDWRQAWWLSLLLWPWMAAWPVAFGLSPDPMLLNIGLLTGGQPGWLAGTTSLDLNVGATTQALGHLAAEQWLHGEVPWWNPYNGLGMPLAGEMQASALFLPFVLLLHFQSGPLLIKLALQTVAGPSAYALLRSLGIARQLAWLGGVLFALSGTFAWLGHAPMMPLAFLPLFLLGIDNARAGGIRLMALALALSLYAGFPETAYLDGLLALGWAVWRGWQADRRWHFAGRVALGGTLGLMLAAPALWSFAHLLLNGSVENHALGAPKASAEPSHAALYAVWLFPYLLGPLLAFGAGDSAGAFNATIGNLGGYSGAALVLLALAGLRGTPYRGLRLALGGWIALAVLRSAEVPGVRDAINLIPLLRVTLAGRYAIGSWHFAAIILAVLALSDWRAGRLRRSRVILAALGTLLLALAALLLAAPLLRDMAAKATNFAPWPVLSVIWGMALAAFVTLLLCLKPHPGRVALLTGLLVANATAIYSLPLLSGPQGASIDREAIGFLHDHVGTQRFYTLGPYRPNYGAYFATAQLNHEYLPLPSLWGDYIRSTLDPAADRIMFRGDYPPAPADHAAQFVAHRAAFEALSVRYLVTPPGENPFEPAFASAAAAPRVSARALADGETLSGAVDAALVRGGAITSVGVEIATYLGQSGGRLVARLCDGAACAEGAMSLAGATDNAEAVIRLSAPLTVQTGDALRWQLRHEGGGHPVGFWLPRPDAAPRLRFVLLGVDRPPPLAYHDRTLDIYDLPDAAPYFSTEGGPCLLRYANRTGVQAQCDAPARLIRRELFFSGWRAEVNGTLAEITPYQGIVQQIALPAGASAVQFRYAPPYAGLSWAVAGLAAAGLLLRTSPRRGSTRPSASARSRR